MVYLRRDISLQRIRVAFESLNRMDLTEHPSRYQLAISGNTIVLVEEDGATDLVEKPGQRVLANLADVFRPFPNFKDQEVVDFLHPRPLLEIREARMGGWPTIRGTRVPYDTIARLQQGDGGVPSEMVSNFYPSVNRRAALDALDFEEQVKAG